MEGYSGIASILKKSQLLLKQRLRAIVKFENVQVRGFYLVETF